MKWLLALVAIFQLGAAGWAQVDDFQDGSTMGWRHGLSNPHAPRIAENEGPGGVGDHALRVSSGGGFGAGSMMVMLNTSQWTGDYLAAGVTGISFDVRHVSGGGAFIRVAVSDQSGPFGTWFVSGTPVTLPAGSSWGAHSLSLQPADLVRVSGTAVAEAVLANVREMRLLSSGAPGFRGDAVAMELLFDNIVAEGMPEAVGIEHLRVTEVYPEGQTVEVTNMSPEPVVVGQALRFSHRLIEETAIPAGTEFAPGESRVFTLPQLDAFDSDVWLYRDDDFSSLGSILSGVKYGPGADVGRTGVAVAGGIWPDADAFVPTPAVGESIQLNGIDPSHPGNWTARTPTPGRYFGTGERIEQPLPALIPAGDIRVGLELFAEGLVAPLGLQDPNDGSGRLFVFDQTGAVWIVRDGVLQEDVFLDARPWLVQLRDNFDERGLLGFVLHPKFPDTPTLYTHTSEPASGTPDFMVPRNEPGDPDHHTVIAEWRVDSLNPNAVDPASRRVLMRIEQPQFNHNGGTVAFGADGLLYIALGDGGGGDDVGFGHAPQGNAQHLGIIHGGILRIDPDGEDSANGQYGIPADNPFVDEPGAIAEMYVYGLRNPFIFSFDRLTGEMYIADAGQHDIEAIYLGEKGANYGWRITEGSFFFRPQRPQGNGFVVTVPEQPLPRDLVNPIAEYTIRNSSRQVVIGGYVYRGSRIPALVGRYVFADWINEMFHLNEENQIQTLDVRLGDNLLEGMHITGFGQDAQGEVYILGSDTRGPTGSTGRVLRLAAAPVALEVIATTYDAVNGFFRIEFTSDLPAVHHRVEGRSDLAMPSSWEQIQATFDEVTPGVFRADVLVPQAPRHFFRVVGAAP